MCSTTMGKIMQLSIKWLAMLSIMFLPAMVGCGGDAIPTVESMAGTYAMTMSIVQTIPGEVLRSNYSGQATLTNSGTFEISFKGGYPGTSKGTFTVENPYIHFSQSDGVKYDGVITDNGNTITVDYTRYNVQRKIVMTR